MNLTLFVDGKEKTFNAPFIKARMFRKALEFNQKMDFKNLGVEEIDELIGFVCELFNNQFTIDEFYDGLPVENLMPTIVEAMESVTGKANGESDEGNGKK